MKPMSIRNLVMTTLIAVILSACGLLPTEEPTEEIPDQDAVGTAAAQTVAAELTAQPSPTSPSSPTPEAPTETPELGSPTPEPSATPVPDLLSYNQEEYGFSFDYLSYWEVLGEPNSLTLTKGDLSLIIGYRFPDEDVEITGTGTPAGDFVERGQVTFLGREIDKIALVAESRVKAMYYHSPNAEITVFDAAQIPRLVFSISLQSGAADLASVDIPVEAQTEVDQILESFEAVFELSETCTDRAEFVEDITIPDDTVIQSGEPFTKTWRLRNGGTCAWTPEYQVVFFGGDQMDAESPIPLPGEVQPGDPVDISVGMTAPGTEDTYRGEWQLHDPDGVALGPTLDTDLTFWVQIVVEVTETTDDLNLGEADWRDEFNSSANWFLLETDKTQWEVEDGQLIMNTFTPGGGDEWALSNQEALTDFYLEATFTTGETCSGLDRYGLLSRAPDTNSGYVYGFSCDGRYRIYKWDGENYTAMREWTSASSIRQGPEQTNRVGFYAQGTTIRLYANGFLLEEMTDSTYAEGRFGLFSGSRNTEDLQIFVDEVAYWILE